MAEMQKNPISGKIFAKFYAILVEKVSNVAILRFLGHFLVYFESKCYFLAFICTIWVVWAVYTFFLQTRFVIINALFREKLFWLKPCLCKKNCLFASLSHGAGKVSYWAGKVSYGAGKVSHSTRKVSYGAGKVSHGAGKVSTVYFLLSTV